MPPKKVAQTFVAAVTALVHDDQGEFGKAIDDLAALPPREVAEVAAGVIAAAVHMTGDDTFLESLARVVASS